MAQPHGRHHAGSSLRGRRGAESPTGSHPLSAILPATGRPVPIRALLPSAVLDLQRTAGNRVVTALFEGDRPVSRGAPGSDRPGPAPPASLNISALLEPQRRTGNRAVAGRLPSRAPSTIQRKVGWTDASRDGKAWNLDEHQVGEIRRLPLEGLTHGLQQETAKVWRWDDKRTRKGHWGTESTTIGALSSESAKGKVIVLLPKLLNPKEAIEVLVNLHGYTESYRPFAGWRELTPKAGRTKNKTLHTLRQGIDQDDIAPVRDIALDQAEQQLEESGSTQTVIVLPQGGLHSQFGTAGDTNFDSAAYVDEIVSRLVIEQVWEIAPRIGRVSMAGHSGAGATLAKMARESVRREAGEKPGASSTLTGDLVIFDAINGPNELKDFTDWATMRLNQDLVVLKDTGKTEAEKLTYLRTAQKLLAFHSKDAEYTSRYDDLKVAIGNWFTNHAAELGPFENCLRAPARQLLGRGTPGLTRGADARRAGRAGACRVGRNPRRAPGSPPARNEDGRGLRAHRDDGQARREALAKAPGAQAVMGLMGWSS